MYKYTLWIGSEELSGAALLKPSAEDKPEHLGMNLPEQGRAQGSFSERREIPNVRLSGTECPHPSLAPSQGIAGPWAVCSHHKQAAGSKLLTVCTEWRQLLLHSTQGLEDLWSQLAT